MGDGGATTGAKARITVSVESGGELEIWVNAEGRDVLIAELIALSKTNDHFHLNVWEGAEVKLSAKPYRPTDKLVQSAKVLFRPDEWDSEHFPHVMESKRGI